LANASERVSYGSGRLSADGRGIVVTTDKESEFQGPRLHRSRQLAAHAAASLLNGGVEDFDLSLDGKTVASATVRAIEASIGLMSRHLALPRTTMAIRGAAKFC
jgi:hypothetical protein